VKEDDKVQEKKIQLQGDYQIARVANANCPCAVFGFWGATAKDVGAADTTAFAGFTCVVTDP
jgi:hypothetical protein